MAVRITPALQSTDSSTLLSTFVLLVFRIVDDLNEAIEFIGGLAALWILASAHLSRDNLERI
ncbi:MAG: hypothetical protein AAF941_04795 [Pseudomonadota bacterium]